jgi:hypothetical protein
MSLIKLSLGGDGKTENPFLQCIVLKNFCRAKCPSATRTMQSFHPTKVGQSAPQPRALLIYVSLPANFCDYKLRQRSLKNDRPLHGALFFCAAATKTTIFSWSTKIWGKQQRLSPGTGIKRPVKRVKRPMLVPAGKFGGSAGILERFRARRELCAAALSLVFINVSWTKI